MASNLHRCPACKTAGKVYRSKVRSAYEKWNIYLKPFNRMYRCHHCNWRGSLVKSNIKPWMVGLVKVVYFIIGLILLLGIYIVIINFLPKARFKY